MLFASALKVTAALAKSTVNFPIKNIIMEPLGIGLCMQEVTVNMEDFKGENFADAQVKSLLQRAEERLKNCDVKRFEETSVGARPSKTSVLSCTKYTPSANKARNLQASFRVYQAAIHSYEKRCSLGRPSSIAV